VLQGDSSTSDDKECYSRFFISTIFTHLRKGVSFVLLSENWKLSVATQNRLAYSAKGVLAKKCFPLPYATSSKE